MLLIRQRYQAHIAATTDPKSQDQRFVQRNPEKYKAACFGRMAQHTPLEPRLSRPPQRRLRPIVYFYTHMDASQ